MNVRNLRPLPGFVVVELAKEERTSQAGIITTENDDDFIVFGKVVSPGSKYEVGTQIVFHVLEGLGFLDGGTKYSFVEEKNVLGTYAPS